MRNTATSFCFRTGGRTWRYVLEMSNYFALTYVSFQYLEVSALYIARARALIHFVMDRLTEIPKDLPIMDAVATEANDGTGGDHSMPEY
jgi:hypothetical protein